MKAVRNLNISQNILNLVLGGLIIVTLGLGGTLLWLNISEDQSSDSTTGEIVLLEGSRYFPTAKFEMPLPPSVDGTEINTWQMRYYNPIVVDFNTLDGGNYILTRYLDNQGVERDLYVFLTGKTPGGETVEKVWNEETSDYIDFDEVQGNIEIGDEIGITYVSQSPTKVLGEIPEAFCESENQRFCLHHDKFDNEKNAIYLVQLNNTYRPAEEKFLPAFTISFEPYEIPDDPEQS